MSRSALAALALLATLCVGCTAIGPAASPTGQPTPTTTAMVTPTASPAAATTTPPTGTPEATPCEDEYNPACYRVRQPSATSEPSDEPSPGTDEATLTSTSGADSGVYLSGPTRMALYTFDYDAAGQSSCTGECAAAWPPLTVAAGETPTAGQDVTGQLGTIERADGTLQVTYDDAPLYYFAGDQAIHDVNGDGVNGVWHLARP